jgi:C-terminal processing protease CtpA/Prc
MILDIRDNSGGFDPNAQYVAGRLAAKEMLYMTTRKKNGPGPNDFAETREWYVSPTGRQQFTKPIIVLTTATTASAAETFLLALRTQDHIRHMGTPTAGSFSDNPSWEAPNGWMYTISVGDFRAADGSSYEGIGISPEILFPSQREDWVAGKDRVLEKALDLFF